MTVGLYTHLDMLDHRPGEGHYERPERLNAVMGALDDASDLRLDRREAPLVDVADLARVHLADYVEAIIASAPATGRLMLDGDTFMSPGSLAAISVNLGSTRSTRSGPWSPTPIPARRSSWTSCAAPC